MKIKKMMMFILLGTSGYVQASSEKSKTKSSDLQALAVQYDRHQEFLTRKEAKTVFFAIYQGLDDDIVQRFVNHALSKSPSNLSSRLFKEKVTQYFKENSPRVHELECKVNRGSLRAAERESCRHELQSLLNTPVFYDNYKL